MSKWLLITAVAVEAAVLSASAADGNNEERKISAALQYSGITLNPDNTINVDLHINNRGSTDETVHLQVVEQPEGWTVQIKEFSTIVSGIFVGAGKEESLDLTAKPAGPERDKLPSGTHRFSVEAKTMDNSFRTVTSIDVTVLDEEETPERLTINTSYPVLRGPSDDDFEFSLDVDNDSDQDTIVNFEATAPPGWEISFKPAHEEKQISSLTIDANQDETVEFEVNPPYNARAGEYDFTVKASTERNEASISLQVVLTGTYDLEAGTPNGLLSLIAHSGEESNLTLFVQNRGSAPQREIDFLSFKPENWEVVFEPENIQVLEPGDLKEVEVRITPGEEALVGDYSVAIQVNGEQARDEVELRVTVKASTKWGWIGVAIIVVVIFGLATVFRTLGRR